MKPTPLAPGPERLLGEADFVRTPARNLVADGAAAEDVAPSRSADGICS
jgi:hypothetical protein